MISVKIGQPRNCLCRLCYATRWTTRGLFSPSSLRDSSILLDRNGNCIWVDSNEYGVSIQSHYDHVDGVYRMRWTVIGTRILTEASSSDEWQCLAIRASNGAKLYYNIFRVVWNNVEGDGELGEFRFLTIFKTIFVLYSEI